MNRLNAPLSIFTRIGPAWSAATATFLLTWLAIWRSSHLNDDATLYLFAADVFAAQGWDAAAAVYPRPFFSALLGSLASLTGVSALVTAFWLNALAFAATAFAFVRLAALLAHEMAPAERSRAAWFAAVAVSLFPGLSSYFDYVIRDPLYWAASLWGLYAALCYLRSADIRYFALALAVTGLAVLLRPEALVLFPCYFAAILLQRDWPARRKLLIFSAGALSVGAGLAALAWLAPRYWHAIVQLLHLGDSNALLATLGGSWNELTGNLREHVLNRYSLDQAPAIAAAAVSIIFIGNVAEALTPAVLLAAAVLIWKGRFYWPRSSLFNLVLAAQILILLAFTVQMLFLQSRYLQLAALLLLLPVTISLARAWPALAPQRFARPVAITLAAVLFIDSHVSFGRTKEHLPAAVNWVEKNLAQKGRVLFNDGQLAYLSGKLEDPVSLRKIRSGRLPKPAQVSGQYEYAVIRVHRTMADNPVLASYREKFELVREFRGGNREQVLVFRIPKPEAPVASLQ